MFLSISVIPKIYEIVKWHQKCNFAATQKCLRNASEFKEATTQELDEELWGYEKRAIFSEFSNYEMETFYLDPLANEKVSLKILKTFKEFYKLLAKYRSQARSGFAVDQLTLIEHMGYSIWLASSRSLLIEGQKNMFLELWGFLQPTIEMDTTFPYKDIPILAKQELNIKEYIHNE